MLLLTSLRDAGHHQVNRIQCNCHKQITWRQKRVSTVLQTSLKDAGHHQVNRIQCSCHKVNNIETKICVMETKTCVSCDSNNPVK
jgi:hypothetical protein